MDRVSTGLKDRSFSELHQHPTGIGERQRENHRGRQATGLTNGMIVYPSALRAPVIDIVSPEAKWFGQGHPASVGAQALDLRSTLIHLTIFLH